MEAGDSVDEVQIGQRGERDLSLSPGSKRKIDHLVKDMKSKKASIDYDDKGQISVNYKSDMKDVMACKDVSQAEKIVSPKNKREELAYVEAFTEIITKIKELKSPSGINFSKDEIYSPNGVYVENKDFEKTGEILGKGITGNIFVVKDKITEKEHALKTVLISECRKEEWKMWIDLNKKDFVPSLLMVRRDKNKIHFHMEKLTEVVTLRDVIDGLMENIDSDKVKGVSLCVLHGLLTAVNQIHEKRWSHNDLHAGNTMLQRKRKDISIDLKIIDFGLGQRMEGRTHKGGKDGYCSDMWNIFRLFIAMYLGEEFNNKEDVEKNGEEKLKKRFDLFDLPEEDRKEILQLYDVFLEITSKDNQTRDTKKVMENVEGILEKHGIDKEEMLEHAAQKLFPELTPLNSMDLNDFTDSPRESKNVDMIGDNTDKINSVGSNGSNSAEVVRDILQELSISPRQNS